LFLLITDHRLLINDMINDNTRPKFITPIPTFHSTQSTVFIPPIFLKIPDGLILWLIKDLPEEALQKILSGPVFKERTKGYRAKSLLDEKAFPLILNEFQKNISFRMHLGNFWKTQEKKEYIKILRGVSAGEMVQYHVSFVDRFGPGPVFWHCALSDNAVLQKVAIAVLKTVQTAGMEGVSRGTQDPPAELKQFKKELDEAKAARDKLGSQAESDRTLIRSLKSEVEALKEETRKLEIALHHEKENTKSLQEQIVEKENKIILLVGAEQAINALEKEKRSKEHGLRSAQRSIDDLQNKIQNLSSEKEAMSVTGGEMRHTLAHLFKYLSSKQPQVQDVKITARIKNFLLISGMKELPADYYRYAASSGLSIQYHFGFQHDIDIEKKCAKTEMIILLFKKWEEVEKHADLTGYLAKNNMQFLCIPFMPPDIMFSFLQQI